jgi:hypothetical protein
MWRSLKMLAGDLNGQAPRAVARLDVSPTISDHHASAQVDSVPRRCREQETRPRFPTLAVIVIIMVADKKVVDGQRGGQGAIDGLHGPPPLASPGYLWLVGHADQHEPCLAEPVQRFWNPSGDPHLGQAGGRPRPAVPQHYFIEHAVPVEEDGAATSAGHAVGPASLSPHASIVEAQAASRG